MTDSPYRILMVLDNLGTGGTETHVLSLSKPLRDKGVELHYAGADGPLYQTFVEAGFQIHIVQSNLEPIAARKEMLKQSYRRIMQDNQINIVHVHQTPSGLVAAAAAKELGIPVVFTMHGTYYPKGEAVQLAQLCEAVITVSKPVQRYWQKAQIPSIVISNGVDFEAYHPITETDLQAAELPDIPSDATVVTYVSRLAWQKATVCNMVLRASRLLLPEIENLHIVVVGTGASSFHVHELAKNLNKAVGKPYIHVVGEQTEVQPFYGISDLVIGTGRVALEALACGKPVLAIGNHGFFGLVTPSSYNLAWEYYFGDHFSVQKPAPNLIADALRKAFANRNELQRIGALGKEWVRSEFDIVKKSAQLLEVYEQVRAKN
ncbi:MAG TPA: glycosyltransferase [Candidatus Bathyarchaeia archaeon]|nr:glycosyltransferase [Candidatus Bathyarchaeia archaeon]